MSADAIWRSIKTTPRWPDLIAALASLDDNSRREVAVDLERTVRELAAGGNLAPEVSTSSWFDAESLRRAALAVTAVGCLPTAAKVEAFIRKPAVRGWLSWFPHEHFVAVAKARNPPWLGELGTRIAERVTAKDLTMYPVASELVALGGAEIPVTAGTVIGWVRFAAEANWEGNSAQEKRRNALKDDQLLGPMVNGLFEIDDAIAAFSSRSYVVGGATSILLLPEILRDLAEAGVLDRGRLLAHCVDRVVRGGPDSRMHPLLVLLEQLAPSVDELLGYADDLLVITDSGGAPAAAQMFRYLVRLADADALDSDKLIAACTSVLIRKEKGTAQKALSRLARLARDSPETRHQVLVAAATAFGHPRVEIAESALDLVSTHLFEVTDPIAVGELEMAAQGLDPTLHGRAGEIFGSGVSADVVAGLVPVEPDLWPGPLDLHDLVNWFAGRPFSADRMFSMVSMESVIAALVRSRHSNPDELADAMAGVRLDESSSFGFDFSASNLITKLAIELGAINAYEHWREFPPEPSSRLDPWVLRLEELVGNLMTEPISVLLATPSHQNGSLDPEILIERLEQAGAAGWTPWPIDFEQALLRLTIPADATAWSERARAIGTDAGSRLADWLDAGGLPHPVVTTKLQTHTLEDYYRPLAEPVVTHWIVAESTPARDPAGPLEAALTTIHRPGDQAVRYSDPPAWTNMMPLPHHIEVLAAWELPHIAEDSSWRPLDPLLRADGPTGSAFGAALCYLLTFRKEAVRIQGVDLLLAAEARGADWGPGLSAALTALAVDNSITVSRIIAPLADAAGAGAGAGVLRTLTLSLPALLRAKVRVLPDLLALTSRLIAERGPAEAAEDAALLGGVFSAHLAGKSRLAVESRRLLEVLG